MLQWTYGYGFVVYRREWNTINYNNHNKKAAIYIRVSTDAQAEEGYSIDAQKEQLTAYCISKNIKKYDYYIDGGWSGSNINRPELQRMITDIQNQKISHVIVYKLDRLSRSQKDTLYLIEDVFNPNDVDFISMNESMDTSTPMGKLMLGILSAFAQLERENIRLRTRMGMLERVKNGYWMGGGRVPFGYDYDSQQGILIPNKDAEKVKQIYELYLKGYAPQPIANILGLKYDRLVIQILKRKSNYGVIEYNGQIYQGKHKPIISKEIYDLTMQEMQRRSEKYTGQSSHLLTGLLYCGKCGAKMRYQKWGNSGNKLVCYSQQTSKKYLIKNPDCDQEKIWAEDIEDAVIQTLFSLQEKEKQNKKSIETTSLVETLQKQKEEYETQLKRLYNLYAIDGDNTLLKTIKEHKNKLQDITNRCDEAQKEQDLLKSKCQQYDHIMIESLQDKWEYMTLQERQNIVRILVDKIVITNKKVEIRLNF